jgi:exodeoxyribonuclease V beta subunit
VAEALRAHGGPEGWAERLTDGLHLAAQVPFGPGEPGLVDLPLKDRLDELGFLVPACGPSPSALAGAFEAHAIHPLVRSYAVRLASMGFPPLQGLLKGYVDMVYRHGDGFGILDYKSNHLGDVGSAYTEAALAESMLHHDYILQYHLYVLALHRFLGARLPGYDYDRHVLGARYLFLRGMVPERGPGAGVFADRPPRGLIEALDGLFGEGA